MKKIGIIGAMDLEVSTLIEKMNVVKTVTKAGMTFNEGKIGDTDVVVVKCGIGKVNAGICVQILVDLFDVTHVINTGVAGSLKDVIDIGDTDDAGQYRQQGDQDQIFIDPLSHSMTYPTFLTVRILCFEAAIFWRSDTICISSVLDSPS